MSDANPDDRAPVGPRSVPPNRAAPGDSGGARQPGVFRARRGPAPIPLSVAWMAGAGSTMIRRVGSGLEDLFPGYFALVMATGIVSIASSLFALRPIAQALLWLNVAQYSVLSLALLLRAIIYP